MKAHRVGKLLNGSLVVALLVSIMATAFSFSPASAAVVPHNDAPAPSVAKQGSKPTGPDTIQAPAIGLYNTILTLSHSITNVIACQDKSRSRWICGASSSTSSTATRNGRNKVALSDTGVAGGPPPTSTSTATSGIPTALPTALPTGLPTALPTALATATQCPFAYNRNTGTAAIVPGTLDTGNHADDGTTTIALPFAFDFYGQSFSNANVSSNGNLQFTSSNPTYTNGNLPDTGFDNTIFAHWDDLLTTTSGTGCATYSGGCGVFTSVTGSAPNRIFNIEWRATYCCSGNTAVNFEIRLYENNGQIDLVYGIGVSAASATVGIQQDTGSQFDQYAANGSGGLIIPGLLISYVPNVNCDPPTATPILPTPIATQPPPTATPLPCVNVILNSGFESSDFTDWTINGTDGFPYVDGFNSHTGDYSAFLGALGGREARSKKNSKLPRPLVTPGPGDSSIYQTVSVPSGATLIFWYYGYYGGDMNSYQAAYIEDPSDGSILDTVMVVSDDTQTWTQVTYDASAFGGQTVRIEFLVHDGGNFTTGMNVDDVVLFGDCITPSATASATPVPPTSTATATATSVPPTNTATATQTPILPTPIPTQPSPTATPLPCVNVIVNGDFETADFVPGWTINGTDGFPYVDGFNSHTGDYSAYLGYSFARQAKSKDKVAQPQVTPAPGDSSIYQTVTVPNGATLVYWYFGNATDPINLAWQDVYVEDSNGNILATVMHMADGDNVWKQVVFNMAAYAGQTVRIEFLVHNSGNFSTSMNVDDVQLFGDCITPSPTATAVPPTNTATATATSVPPTATHTATATPMPPTSTATATSVPPTSTDTATATPVPPTSTPTTVPTLPATLAPTNTATSTSVPPTSTATSIPPTSTATSVPPTATITNVPPTSTATPLPATATPVLPTATPTVCPITFPDVPQGSFAHDEIIYLACHGIVTGYADGYFRPTANTTRAHFTRMTVLAFGYPLVTPATPTYTDVHPNHWAYLYIESATAAGVAHGYLPSQCLARGRGFPCFIPDDSITRAEFVVIDVQGKNWPANCPTQVFPDVPPSHWAYCEIGTGYNHGVITGYPGDPAYFRPERMIIRSEISIILYRTIFAVLRGR